MRALRPYWLATLAGIVVACAGMSGCKREAPAPSTADKGGPLGPRDETHRGVRFAERFPNGANEASPLVVALHGLGGSPEELAGIWDDAPLRAELAMAQAPLRYGSGFAWFEWSKGMSEDELAAAITAAVDALFPAMVELARGRKIVVTGFSQGAVLSYALAARHPDEIAYAFPIAGRVPRALWPKEHDRAAPVYALHGTDDERIDVDLDRATVAAFEGGGRIAELREFPGVRHTVTASMRHDLWDHVANAIGGAPTR